MEKVLLISLKLFLLQILWAVVGQVNTWRKVNLENLSWGTKCDSFLRVWPRQRRCWSRASEAGRVRAGSRLTQTGTSTGSRRRRRQRRRRRRANGLGDASPRCAGGWRGGWLGGAERSGAAPGDAGGRGRVGRTAGRATRPGSGAIKRRRRRRCGRQRRPAFSEEARANLPRAAKRQPL